MNLPCSRSKSSPCETCCIQRQTLSELRELLLAQEQQLSEARLAAELSAELQAEQAAAAETAQLAARRAEASAAQLSTQLAEKELQLLRARQHAKSEIEQRALAEEDSRQRAARAAAAERSAERVSSQMSEAWQDAAAFRAAQLTEHVAALQQAEATHKQQLSVATQGMQAELVEARQVAASQRQAAEQAQRQLTAPGLPCMRQQLGQRQSSGSSSCRLHRQQRASVSKLSARSPACSRQQHVQRQSMSGSFTLSGRHTRLRTQR